jgi:hypothetical protein
VTAAKFKPLIFSVWGLALSNGTNIFIFMILDDFPLSFKRLIPTAVAGEKAKNSKGLRAT